MSDAPEPGEDVALLRFVGGLFAAAGLIIALLCGGCAVAFLASPGGLAWSVIPVLVGGAPAVVGLLLLRRGARLMKMAPLVIPAAPRPDPPRRSTLVAGWAVVALGGLIALYAAVKIVASMIAMSVKTGDPQGLPQIGGFILALAHAVLLVFGAAVIEGGRQILRNARPIGGSRPPLRLP